MQVQWDQIISYYLFYSLGGLAILFTLIHMLYKRRSPLSMTAWLLLMILAPYFFVLFYFFFGIRKRSLDKEKSPLIISAQDEEDLSVHPIDTLLRHNGIPASTRDNDLLLYTDGIEAYEALYESLKEAQYSISISTYLVKNDKVTRELFDLLMQKAKDGVEVRILTDTFGSMAMYLWRFPLRRLKSAGIQVSFFMPLFAFPLHNRFNLRYHRKIYLIDNKTLFSGGMNLAKEYMGPKLSEGRWSDLLFRCEGPMVNDYRSIFESDWAFSQQVPIRDISLTLSRKKGDCITQVIPSGADIISDALLEAIVYGIHQASKRVWIVTPYFIPHESILQALGIALHRGVDVKLITPQKSDNIIADLGRSSYLRESFELGIDVALYQRPMLHAKAILFDDAVILGSLNLDNRSLLLNYEVATIIYSKKQVDTVERWMKTLLENSTAYVEPANKIRLISENLMRIFVPQL